ncbi:dihydroorotate dehydrogenase electron transfer subunit [Lachnospiraceae bacterium]|jgi:dihydroorotate dehydrogenase electron transfer subunit|nr:dihydroorotate dehydrogenase electron transfer subunit [Ruminococcus sp.]NBJ03481.1 dihydroorotate dehydrogenase electron transfer subunit [Lachnospiraceae bacterium]
MSCKRKEKAAVVLREQIARDIYSMWIRTEEIAGLAVPGQFISMYTEDRSKILPRPISLCEIDRERKQLRVVFRVTGKGTGTEQLSRLQPGDFVEILGPLGNGFPLEPGIGKKVFLIGGGIGVPPMLELAKQLDAEKHLVMGYRDEQFLTEEFQKNGNLFIATEDGSAGTPGNVMDAIAANGLDAEVIYACGPAPMLRAVKQYAEENHIVCYVSMEERMACGVGACLACICRTPEIDEHSQVHNKRVCKDGPVFLSTEVEI